MPLSVEGQAHRLIEEASNKDNLGMMYIWWCVPYRPCCTALMYRTLYRRAAPPAKDAAL